MALTHRALWLLVPAAVALVLWPGMSAVRWWWLASLIILAVDWWFAPRPGTLQLDRLPLDTIRLGASATSTLVIGNPSTRRIRALVRDSWPPSAGASGGIHRIDIPAGEQRRTHTSLLPSRRGDASAGPVTVRAPGPLGLCARQASREVPGGVRVLHPFASRRQIPAKLAQLRQLDGRSAVLTRGQGTQFDSLRQYVDGDDVRSIDWRATARSRDLVVRTWQPEQDRRVVIVIDSSRTSAARLGDAPRLDAAMDAALLLTAIAAAARDRVEVVAGDRRLQARVTSSSDHTHTLRRVISALAPVEPTLVEADWSTLLSAVDQGGNRRALVVLLTSLHRSPMEEGLLPHLPRLTARHRVVVAAVSDPALTKLSSRVGDLTEAYDAAAAERTLAQRAATAVLLRRVGVRVLDADAADLPVALVDYYLSLKRHGQL